MNFSTWSIRQPVPAIAAFLVLLMIGLYSFHRLPVTAMPNIDLPLVSVTVAQPGAAPSTAPPRPASPRAPVTPPQTSQQEDTTFF